MKKLLFVTLLFGLFVNVLNAQNKEPVSAETCACNPDGFNPFKVTTRNGTVTVRCGHQFTVKCNEGIKMEGGYKCVGVKCAVKFVAVLKNTATGAVIQNYSAFTFPWNYSFLAPGNYALLITPICGINKCTPCVFYFTVVCDTPPAPTCGCNGNRYSPFTAFLGNEKPIIVNCNHQFSIKKNIPLKLEGKYSCGGDCSAVYKAVLKNNVTGAIVQSYSNFSFPWSYTFSVAGNYKLEITAYCDSNKCETCVFYFTVA